MRSRLLGALAAFLLAIIGTGLTMTYVNGAEERAYAGVETTSILVVTQPVPAGTPADVALKSAELQELPARGIADDALADGAAVTGMVTTVDLVAGEQVLSTRFAAEEEASAEETIEVPAGDQEVSFALDAERTVGGQLAPGDTVGVFISIGNGTEPPPGETALTLHKVLITKIHNGTPLPAADMADGTEPSPEQPTDEVGTLPTGDLMITVAVSAAEAERIVWGREFGTLWLSREPADAIEDDTDTMTQENVLQ